MKESFKKSISVISVIIFAVVVYREVIGPVFKASNGALQGTSITEQESQKIYEMFGGEKQGLPITIFVTSWCSICKALEGTLENAGIKYAKADIESDRNAYLYYQRIVRGKTSGVPVTLIGKEVFLGYDISNISRAIKALAMSPKKV